MKKLWPLITAVLGFLILAVNISAEEFMLDYLESEMEINQDGSWVEAASVLEDGFKNADLDSEQEYLFCLGYTYAMMGENGKTLKYLSGVKADGSEDYFGNYVLVKGQLLMDSLSYKRALDLFNRYFFAYPDGDNTRILYFMAEICPDELGKTDKARQPFKEAQRISPDSEAEKAEQPVINKL